MIKILQEKKGFKILTLKEPLVARNVDGTKNKTGMITSFVNLTLTINGRKMTTDLMVTGLGKQNIILGFPWLNEQNPDIDWKTGKFTWRIQRRSLKIKRYHDTPQLLNKSKKPTIVEEPDEEEYLNRTQYPRPDEEILLGYIEEAQKPNEVWIN